MKGFLYIRSKKGNEKIHVFIFIQYIIAKRVNILGGFQMMQPRRVPRVKSGHTQKWRDEKSRRTAMM